MPLTKQERDDQLCRDVVRLLQAIARKPEPTRPAIAPLPPVTVSVDVRQLNAETWTVELTDRNAARVPVAYHRTASEANATAADLVARLNLRSPQ